MDDRIQRVVDQMTTHDGTPPSDLLWARRTVLSWLKLMTGQRRFEYARRPGSALDGFLNTLESTFHQAGLSLDDDTHELVLFAIALMDDD